MGATRYLPILLLAFGLAACSGSGNEKAPAAENNSAVAASAPEYEAALPPELRVAMAKRFTGDLDAMITRRMIRVGVPYNRTFYFIDKGQPRGLSYEYMALFEEQLNKKLNTGDLRIHIVAVPMPRDMLFPALTDGKVDMVVAQLTITPERLQQVAFTNPTRTDVNEIVVTGPGSPTINALADLSGKQVFVRKTSSYYTSLEALNRTLAGQGKPPVRIREAPENLEDDDLLEMVNAGLVPATVVDNYLADYWKQVFPKLNVHSNLALRTGGNLAVAIRKGSPKLAGALNEFLAANGLNSVTGRVLSKRYLQNTDYVKDAASEAERAKFLAMADLFKRYGERYKFDYLLMAAQGYQESRLDNAAKSHVGAIGVMQLMPATAKEQNVGDVRQLEPNIHAGVKYMRFMRDRYFAGEPMDDLNKALFTFASYNAGAGRIRQLRRLTQERGLNPNIWFGNVEQVASEEIGRETVTYVSNIFKYYLAYRLISEQRQMREAAKADLAKRAR